ncbi:hypothetical protein GCM10027075_29890 [Streptomyces heilongjiangensis]
MAGPEAAALVVEGPGRAVPLPTSRVEHGAVRCPRLWITSWAPCDRCDDVTAVATGTVPDARG